ncbi:MAG TPA: hypothetical protein VFA56_13815 [Gaiellaceae bacterium]|nr:hypothetical protein [Gaiellaceae bacterium]
MQIIVALSATLASACALNVGYLLEHGAVRTLPPLTARRPLHSLRLLLGNRRWLLGFGIEAGGWMLFVVALALAPLSLVQATAAGGIGILAVLSVHVTRVPLSGGERVGVAIAVGGLVLLGISLAGGHGEGADAPFLSVAAWVAASIAAAAAAIRLLASRLTAGVAYGLSTGLLFAAGDVATKSAVERSGEPVFVAALVACYAFGTLVLQAGFQHGSPLATAGLATLLTNALPIVAGMTIFSEPLPDGLLGAIRLAAFVAVVTAGVFLGERKHGRPSASTRDMAAAEPVEGACSIG